MPLSRPRRRSLLVLLAGCLALPLVVGAPVASGAPGGEAPVLGLVGTYVTDDDPETAGGEVAALRDDRMYVINGTTIEVVDVADPAAPAKVGTVDLAAYGASITSVAAGPAWVAAVLPAAVESDPGTLVLLRPDGRVVRSATVGALPDMVTFDTTGLRLLVANEGQPSSYGQPDSVDPEGSVSIVNAPLLALGLSRLAVRTIGFGEFNAGGPRAAELPADVRIFGPGASVAQDLEPEYIATDPVNPFRAWVTLQENNAVAELDLLRAKVSSITALGTKDFSAEGAGLDPSDRDGAIAIAPWPVKGLYQPDAIDTFRSRGRTFLVTANEGDAREYDGFEEAVRVGSDDYPLDPTVFPDAEALKEDAALGRLNVTSVDGRNADGTAYEQITTFGARSFSIWRPGRGLVWDSGDQLEQVTAAQLPANFNSTNDEDTFDTRSDDKGPEPEGVAVGTIGGRTLAFVGLERIGGFVVYDLTDPTAPEFSQYLNNRVFDGSVGPDSGPEVVSYVEAGDSPNGAPLVLVSNEISGTVSLYQEVDG